VAIFTFTRGGAYYEGPIPTPQFLRAGALAPPAGAYSSFAFSGDRIDIKLATSRDIGSIYYNGESVFGTGFVTSDGTITDGTVQHYFIDAWFSVSVGRFGSSAISVTMAVYDLNISVVDLLTAYQVSAARGWELMTLGNDVFMGNQNSGILNQVIDAGAGDDIIVMYESGAHSSISSLGYDRLVGGSGANVIYAGDGQDVVFAGDDAETALTDAWSIVLGGFGYDTIYSGWGSNTYLDGGGQDDVIVDGFGTDVLIGGAGNDYLMAGTGTNYIVVNAADVIAGEVDRIYYFTQSNTTYLQLPSAWANAVGHIDDGTKTTLYMSTTGGTFSIEIHGASSAYVWSHVYFA
jgi:Ca2+-binding RTX toxin-like protein